MKRFLHLPLPLSPSLGCGLLFLLALALPPGLRAQTPGSLDPAYKNPATNLPAGVVVAQTDASGVTKAIVGGSFNALLDDASTPVPGFARFNADGSLDTAFLAKVSGTPLGTVTALAVQPDGKILVAGSASGLVTDGRSLLRFGADGTPDAAFQVTLDDDVESIAFQPDGSILISGFFTTVNGTAGQRRFARLSPAGVLDTSFQAFTNNALTVTEVKRIAVLPGGGLLAVAHVSEGGVDYLVQLAGTDGSVPDAPAFFHLANDGRIYDLNVDGAGRVVVVGNFDGIDGHPRASHIARFTADGQIDNNFVGNPSLPSVLLQSVVVDANGQPLVGGVAFTGSVLFRLTADVGLVDPSFSFPLGGDGNYIQSLALQPDGAVLAAGQFQNGQRAANLLRVVTGTGGGGSTGGSVVVPGTANPYLAGLPDGTTASGGDDSAPAQSPVLVPGLTLNPAKPLNFSVAGSVSTDGTVQPTESPDGGFFFAHDPENSFTKLVAPINSLVGVFLSDDAPDPTQINTQVRDFSDAAATNGGVNFTGYQPDLGKPFFIGDGKTSAGVVQNVYPPAGATRLFLGVLDGNDYFNNLGQFRVGATQSTSIDASDLRLGQGVSSPTSDNGSSALIGDKITYTFHLKNEGSHTFTNLVVKDVLPGVCEFVSASDGGTFKGGVVTWNLASFAPTGSAASKDLTLVVKTFAAGDSGQNVASAQINQVINNLDYYLTGDGLPQTVNGLDLQNTTALLAPVKATFTSNGPSVAPGQSLMYTVDLLNTTGAKVKAVTFTVAIPTTLKSPTYYFADSNGARLTDLDANVSFDGNLLTFNVGGLKANQDVRLVITGNVPFDANPDGDFALTAGKLVTKTSDAFGQNTYSVLAPPTKLAGATVAPPAVLFAKVIPDGPSLVTFFKLSPKFAKKAAALLPDLHFFKTDASGKQVLDDVAVAAFGTSLNPSIGEENDDSGNFTTVALPKPGKPAPTVTVALFYSNSGGADAQNLVLRDPVPEGFTYLDGSALLNGKYGKPVPVSVENNGRLLSISPGKVKAGDSGLLLYTLTLNANPPAAGSVESTKGAQLLTSSLNNSVNAFPDGPDLLLVGNFFVQADPSLPTGTQVPVNGVVTYDLLYTNTGSKAAKDFQVTCSVPSGTQFVRALPLNLDRSEPAGGDTDSRVSRPAVGAATGQIVFSLGKLGLHKQGRVRVQYRLTAAQLAKGLPDVPNPFVVSDGPAPATALAEMHRVTRGLDPVRRPRQVGADSSVTTTPVARILDPTVPRLFVVKTVPMAVDPNKTFDYLITVGNLADVPFGDVVDNKSNGLGVEQLPSDVQFVSIQGNDDTASAPAHADAKNQVLYTVPPLAPHSSATIKITVRPKSGTAGKSLTIPPSELDVLSLSVNLYSGALTTRVIDASQLKVSSADITGAAVARFNATAASVPNVTGNLTYKSVYTSVVGADDVTFTNGALLIPLGNGQAFLSGSKNAVGTTGGASYTGSSAGTLAFSTTADQLYVHNLVGKPPGGGQSSVVLTATGRDVATILRQIVTSDANSVVAKSGASPHPSGALNLFGATPGTFVSNDPAPPPPQPILSSLLPPGGLALATGVGNTTLTTLAGTLPADGSVTVTKGGNIVATGGGNVVSNDGGSLIGNAGGTLTPIGSSQNASSVVSNDGGSLFGDGGSGLLNQDGGGLITNDGGGLITNDGGG